MHFRSFTPALYTGLSPLFAHGVLGHIFEQLHEIPRGWNFEGNASPSETIHLRISLQNQNVQSFYQKFLDISTPGHEAYGRHMERHEIRDMLKPKDDSSGAILDWLEEFNITEVMDGGDWVSFHTTVERANQLLDTKFSWFRSDDGEELLRTLNYSLPEFVAEHINFVQPTTRFGNLKQMRSSINVIKGKSQDVVERTVVSTQDITWQKNQTTLNTELCNEIITPQCLFQLYNIHYTPSSSNGNKIGYASFLEQYARYSDLEEFTSTAAPYAATHNFSVVEFNGGLNNQSSTLESKEANLDNQYIVSLGYPTPVTEFSTGGRGLRITDGDSPNSTANSNEPYLDFLLGVMGLPNDQLPQTISISYGENEQEIPYPYAEQVCFLFAQLGARGVSVIFASGDTGAGSYCESNDGTSTPKLQPTFPATCPFVTSVGGTMSIPETATYYSSGGFSNYFPRPAYQEASVETYLNQVGDKNKGYYNVSGRGYPDVAAQSRPFIIYDSGSIDPAQGTSCAAPVFASIVALLNSARLDANLPPLGFLNPWLYSIGKYGLNDITTGGNTGCDGSGPFHGMPNDGPIIKDAGWNATVGWDAVTGLGTPNFGKLLKLIAPEVRNEGGVLGGCGEE